MAEHKWVYGKSSACLEISWRKSRGLGKMGTKRSILVESSGVPLTVIILGPNTHDIELLENTLDAVIVTSPEITEYVSQHFCA